MGREREIWRGMIARCHGGANGTGEMWEWYGAHGLTVCERWRGSFVAFFADMGARPTDKHSVDRANNGDGYHCGKCDECARNGWAPNCRWATRAEQARNKSNSVLVQHGGRTLTLAEVSAETGIAYATLYERWRRGDEGDRLLREPRALRRDKIEARAQRVGMFDARYVARLKRM